MNANLKKAWYYCKRNGLTNTVFAALERINDKNNDCYEWTPLTEDKLERQRQHTFDNPHTFSVLVPAYETDARFLRQMIESVTAQTYPHWELIIADAGKTDAVEKVVSEYLREDGRIVYKRLTDNRGIAHNTNEALALATGDYIGLLDHDDVLTPDALYEMMLRIAEAEQSGNILQLLYSDEDKCDTDMQHYYEPHFKEEFNLDLILSNNYICHFLVMKAELMKQIRFQSDYDGAQDYKLVLDAVAAMIREAGDTFAPKRQTAHIPKVLYHWRCHTGSTAQNPQSKLYAYEAGRRAVQSFCEGQGWHGAVVEHMRHLGFYKVKYQLQNYEKLNQNIIFERATSNGRSIIRALPTYFLSEKTSAQLAVAWCGMEEYRAAPTKRTVQYAIRVCTSDSAATCTGQSYCRMRMHWICAVSRSEAN